MPRLPQQPRNALSNSAAGEQYTGLGFFSIGQHITHSDVSDLIKTLHRLRRRKMLPALPTTSLNEVKAQLAKAWLRPMHEIPQNHAVRELLEDLELLSDRSAIYVFPDSARLSYTAQRVWGVFGRDGSTRTTHLYISTDSGNLASTILHTSMSSCKCSRLQCFLAEYTLAERAGTLSLNTQLPERFQDDIEDLGAEGIADLMERLEHETCPEATMLFAKLIEYCEVVLERERESVRRSDDE